MAWLSDDTDLKGLKSALKDRDAVISTQAADIERMYKEATELKRIAEEAKYERQIEADKSATTEAQLKKKEEEARSLAVAKANLETSYAASQEKLKGQEKEAKQLRSELDSAGSRTEDAQTATGKLQADLAAKQTRIRALEAELRTASSAPSSSNALPNKHLIDLERQLTELRAENAALRNASSTTTQSDSRRRPRSSSFNGGAGSAAVADLASSELALQAAKAKLASTENQLLTAQNKLAALERSTARELEAMKSEVAEAKDEATDLRRDLEDRDQIEAKLAAEHATKLDAERKKVEETAEAKLKQAFEEQMGQREVLTAHLADARQRVADLEAQAGDAADRQASLLDRLSELDAVTTAHASIEMQLSISREAAEALRLERDALLHKAAAGEAKDVEAKATLEGMREAAGTAAMELSAARERQCRLEEQLSVRSKLILLPNVVPNNAQTQEECLARANAEVTASRQRIAMRDETITRLQSASEAAQASRLDLDARCRTLETERSTAEAATLKAQRELEEAVITLGTSRDVVSRLEADLAARPIRSHDDKVVEALQHSHDRLLEELEAAAKAVRELEVLEGGASSALDEARTRIAMLQDELVHLTTQRDEAIEAERCALFSADVKAGEFARQLTDAQMLCAGYEARAEEHRAELASMLAKQTEVEARRESAAFAKEANARDVETLREEVAGLSMDLANTKATLVEEEKRTSTLREQLSTAQAHADDAETRYTELSTRCTEFETSLSAAQQDLLSLRQELVDVRSGKQAAEQQINTMGDELIHATAMLTDLEKQLAESSAAYIEALAAAQAAPSLSASEGGAEALVRRLRSERDAALNNVAFLNAEAAAAQGATSRHLQAAELYTSDVVAAEAALEALRSEMAVVEEEREQLRATVNTAAADRTESQEALDAMRQEMEEARLALPVVEMDKARLQAELESVQISLSNVISQLQQVDDLQAELERAKMATAEAEAALSAAHDELEHAQPSLGETASGAPMSEEDFAALQNELDEALERLEEQAATLDVTNDLVDSLREQLDEARTAVTSRTFDVASPPELLELQQTNKELTERILRRTEQIGLLQAELRQLETNLALAESAVDSPSGDITGVFSPTFDEQLRQQLDEALERECDLQASIVDLNVSLHACIFVALQHRAELATARSQLSTSSRTASTLSDELARAQTEATKANEVIVNERAASREALELASVRLETAISAHLALEADLAAAREAIDAERSARNQVEEQLVDLEGRHASMLDRLEQAKGDAATSKAAAEGAEYRIRELCAQLGKQRAEAEEAIVDLGRQVDALRCELDEAGERLRDSERTANSTGATSEEVDKLRSELAEAKQAKEAMQVSINIATQEVADLREEASASASTLGAVTTDLQAARREATELADSLKAAIAQREALEGRIVSLEEMLAEAENVRAKAHADAEEARSRMSTEITTLRKLCAQKDEATQRLQLDLTETREEATAIINDFNALSSELEQRQAADETRDLESVHQEQAIRNAELDRQFANEALETLRAEHAASQARVTELESQLSAKEEEVEEADDRHLAALKDIKRQSATVEKLKVRCETLQRQIASMLAPPPSTLGQKRMRPAGMEVAERNGAEAVVAPAPAPGPTPSSATAMSFEPLPIRAETIKPATSVSAKPVSPAQTFKPKRPLEKPRAPLAPIAQQQAAPQDKAASLSARLKAYQRM